MIIVGGSNVYPAEVESALEEHPGVHCAWVLGLPTTSTGDGVG
jgi:bile acid-coenzyme A ligase